jgi:hypothetical protein
MRVFPVILGCLAGIALTEASEAQSWVPTASYADMLPAPAIEGAKAWLTLVDGGNSDQSWSQPSAYFQSHVSKPLWAATVKQVRDTYGHVLYRTLSHGELQDSLPDAPVGRYAVLHFITDGSKHRGIETVTMVMQDGTWQVAGYYISRPNGLRHVPGVGALPMRWE